MPVLTITGKPINWAKPPKPTDRVMWSKRDTSGRKVTGSLRTIAHLDTLDALARTQFGKGVEVIQPPYNTGVKASAGTHDYDACWDVYIPGVPWRTQEKFFREYGSGAYWRKPPAFGNHIHGFTLPPREGREVSDDFAAAGFKVGKYVDGGYSLYGRKVASSQIEDYYNHRSALAGHAKDDGWFPTNIAATIFDLPAYIRRQRAAQEKEKPVVKKRKVLGLSWNLLVGRKAAVVARELASLIRTNGRPKFVAVQEARGYRSVLKSVAALLRYTVLQPKDQGEKRPNVQVREAGSTALLIRRGVPIQQTGELRVNGSWVGPKARLVHEGRVFPWAVIMIDGKWTLVISVHMPTGKNGPNRDAWNATLAAIQDLVKHLGLPFIIVGDWNDPWTSTGPRSPRAMAERLGGRLVHTDTRIDYALKKDQSVMVTKASARTSDHPAIRIEKKD